jgi:hypothetical protein
MIDFVSYERLFLHDLTALYERVLPQLEDTKFSKLHRQLSDLVKGIRSIHVRLLTAVEELVKKRPPDCIVQFIKILVDNQTVLQSHETYLNKFIVSEPLAISLSYEQSQDYQEILNGRVLLQLLRAPIAWQKELAQTTRSLSKVLPSTVDHKYVTLLETFAEQCEILVEQIDAIPKLEQISKKCLTPKFPIVVPGRRILMEGQAKKHCRKNVCSRDILLFSDIFVYAQKKKGFLCAMADYPLTQMRVVCQEPSSRCISVYTPKKSFVLEYDSVDLLTAWLKSFETAVQNAKENADQPDQIEECQEAPIWMPDKATLKCMDCQEVFTMTNRRHHCRRCGNIFCKKCLPTKIILPGISDKPVLCCRRCYEQRG